MTMIKTAAAAIALAAALAAPGTVAHAGKMPSVKVSYADLNLSSKAGQEIFDRRIKNAVEKVCGRLDRTLANDVQVRRCRKKTIAAAQASRDLAVANYSENRFAKADSATIRMVAQ
ncbi:MAG: UrcA family protein [Pseudomonadota bacterium]